MIDAVSAGFSRWAVWPAPGTAATVALGPMARGEAAGDGGELGVVDAGHDQDRHLDASRAGPTAAPGCRCRPVAGWRRGPAAVLASAFVAGGGRPG